MQPALNSDYVTYTMTDEESNAGLLLNHLQKAVIQNERVAVLNQLAYLKPDDMSEEGKESFWQQEAYLRGQLDILVNLLDKSSAVETALNASPNPL